MPNTPAETAEILLLAINARYRHTSIGIRCLQANLLELESCSEILEFTTKADGAHVVAEVAKRGPAIIGIGVYIWNVHYVEGLVARIRAEIPTATVVLGGPEVSHEWQGQRLELLADYVVQGEGEVAFRELCGSLLSGERPDGQVIVGGTPPMSDLELPYRLYTDEDIANRVIYVEASRGCPYRCEFCLSSLDKRVRDVDFTRFFQALDELWNRGVRDFKFIDRTFNLSLESAFGS